MISDDVCSPLSLGEGWGEAPIKVSAPLMSSSARNKERPPQPLPKRGFLTSRWGLVICIYHNRFDVVC